LYLCTTVNIPLFVQICLLFIPVATLSVWGYRHVIITMSKSRSTQCGHARGDLDCSHELNCELGESCFDSVTHEGAHAFAADRCPDNEVDYVETFAVSDLECSGVGVALVNHQFRI
jgi:hypothetical protein